MSDAQNVDLKPTDRMAQVGILIADQVGMALISDTYQFPQVTSGHMHVANDGTLSIDGPVAENVKTSMMFKKDDKTTQFGTWNHTEMDDTSGNQLWKVDQVNMAYLLDALISNKMGSHIDFMGPDGQVRYSMDGFTALTPKDGSAGGMTGTALPDPGTPYTNDSTYTVKDSAGNYLADVHITAKPQGSGNVLDIKSTYSNHGNYVGDLEEVIYVDPNNHNQASFAFQREYNPPPPPPPTTTTGQASS